jgi:hypothetical protein
LFGADSVLTSTTTRYLYPGFQSSNAASSDVYRMAIPRAGKLRNLYVYQNTPSTSANAIVYTVMVNGSTTALTVSIAGTATSGSDTTDSVNVSAGDSITIQVTKASSVSPAVQQVLVSMEFV